MKALEHTSFSKIAKRAGALYNEEEDTLLLNMLGQEYVVRHEGIFLHGQKAPDNHASVILDYLYSAGIALAMTPWRSTGDLYGSPVPDFRKKVELPLTQYAAELITRANALLPMLDAKAVPSLIGSDMAIIVRALPKVYLRVEMSQETQDFPAEVWVLFSHNADDFLSMESVQMMAEMFKDRLLSLLRIY